MRYIIAVIISIAVLVLGWTVSHSAISEARQWADAGAALSSSQRVLFRATAWFVRLFPFMVVLLPLMSVLIARVTAPRKDRDLR